MVLGIGLLGPLPQSAPQPANLMLFIRALVLSALLICFLLALPFLLLIVIPIIWIIVIVLVIWFILKVIQEEET